MVVKCVAQNLSEMSNNMSVSLLTESIRATSMEDVSIRVLEKINNI